LLQKQLLAMKLKRPDVEMEEVKGQMKMVQVAEELVRWRRVEVVVMVMVMVMVVVVMVMVMVMVMVVMVMVLFLAKLGEMLISAQQRMFSF